MTVYHDEVEIEDFEYDEEEDIYYYPCPCGDRFEISKVNLILNGNLSIIKKTQIYRLAGRFNCWRRGGNVSELFVGGSSDLRSSKFRFKLLTRIHNFP